LKGFAMPGLHSYAARRDANEGEIIKALEGIGASVVQLSKKGCGDLLIGYHDRDGYPMNFLIEVKTAKGELTPDEIEFRDNWQGQYAVCRTVDEALQAIGAID
jgi:hypothetical protein